jgi:thioester reductase-like protein
MLSILEKLNYWTEQHPDKLLYSFLDLSGAETERLTYAALQRRIEIIAGHLRSVHGFQTNDRLLLVYPAGLEIIAAFFACLRAGLTPVPVYPPNAHGFRAALYKMAHIAKDCGAAGILTSRQYHSALTDRMHKHNGNGDGSLSAEMAYIAGLKRLVTADMQELIQDAGEWSNEIAFLQYTSGSTNHPKGVMVTHENLLHNCTLVVDHPSPVAVSWLPQYHDMGLIGYYLYSAFSGGTTYGFSPLDFIQRPSLWFETITKYRATASSAPNFAFEYCLRPGRISKETIETTDLSSLRFLMAAAEPVRPGTYERFLETYQPLGLRPESFYVAYGLAENTLAVSSYGRSVLSVSRKALALRRVRLTTDVSEIAGAKRIVSCGRPLGDVVVRIVDPEKHVALDNGNVGEIWVRGSSKCAGYWNNSELTKATFGARIIGESQHEEGYLRTGDLGFLEKGELYVCGRTKDMIIVRGQNYYPHDIEHIVEDSSDLIRKSCVVAFEIGEDRMSALAIVAEVKAASQIPDAREIVAAVRNSLNVEAAVVAFVAPKSVPKTSSGKIMRHLARQMWLDKQFNVLHQFSGRNLGDNDDGDASVSPFQMLKTRYGLTGNEAHSLIEAGVDSLDLVVFMHEIKELLKERGAAVLADDVDIRLIQHLSVANLFELADLFDHSPASAIIQIKHSLVDLQERHRKREEMLMAADRHLMFVPPRRNGHSTFTNSNDVLLTGGTGFVGPFLLKSLLEQTSDNIRVLVRAPTEQAGKKRLWETMQPLGNITPALYHGFDTRVIAVPGNLGQEHLGLSKNSWAALTERVHTIYHNGAAVNYLLSYDKMRAANVVGTNEVVRLAFEHSPKVLNYVSTTFIFGWAVKEVLFETDSNDKMELLDFGYSQSKWVAEQIVFDAARQGLTTRVFRPALISPSVMGGGNNLDIAIRLLAFMINHGVGVEALNQVSFVPADVVADNIVAISNMAGTANATYHVTRDQYANMMDITNIMTRMTGRQFELFKLPAFVPEVIKRCTKNDPLFPLLDFLIGSIDSIASMEFKRYDSSGYQGTRDRSRWGRPDPSLEQTVLGLLRFMSRKGLISVSPPDSVRVLQKAASR